MWPFKTKIVESKIETKIETKTVVKLDINGECITDIYRVENPSASGYAYFLTAEEAFASSDRDWVGVIRMRVAKIGEKYYWLSSNSHIEITKGKDKS